MLYIHNSRNRVKCYVNIINLICRWWIHHGILPNIHKSRGEETSASVSNNHSFIRIENIITPPSVDVDIATGCSYKLSRKNLLFGPLKCSKSNFNPVHVFLHFNSFCLEVLKLILASKLS